MWLYKNNKDNRFRYVLGELWEEGPIGPLICIGVNPSTAEPHNLDPTVKRVQGFAKAFGFNGWIMLNLYPQRATNPDMLYEVSVTKERHRNIKEIQDVVVKYPYAPIWCAWGNSIERRPYIIYSCKFIVEALHTVEPLRGYPVRYVTIGGVNKTGHPKHPLYLPKDADVKGFDMRKYVKEVLK